MTAWTREAIEALGPVTDVPTVASIFGVNKDTVYAQIRRGEWQATRVLTLGRKLKVPTRDLLDLLYAAETAPAPSKSEAEQQCASGPHSPSSDAMPSHIQCGCRVGESAVIRPLRGA
ncbi:helix-turn-helix domain-containing protein [Streptomyces sp. NPDC046909]|uniref:helix-turn-helix domain-containing protein n=1 Tax=Streptomyces sp. NPDC046909 TaxID=3155617 RepID=UPI0033DE3CC6